MTIDDAFRRVSEQSAAIYANPDRGDEGGLSAVEFERLDAGPCPDCGRKLDIGRIETTTLGRDPAGRRRYIPGQINCWTGCY